MAKKHSCALRIALVLSLVSAMEVGWLLATSPATSRAAPPTPPTVILGGERVEQSSVAVADFDGDGDKEIVVGGRDGMLYVIANNGSSWSVAWSRQTASDLNAAGAPGGSSCVTNVSDIRSSPAMGDLDDDGHLEIVVGTGGDVAQHRNGGVLVYRYDWPWSFSVVPDWPQPRIDQVGRGSGSSNPDGCWDGIWSTPALGDLDGDGDLEVVVEGFDRRIHAWHHDGTAMTGWPIYRGSGDALLRGGWSSPALGDIDGDGLPEVIVGTDSPPWEGEGGPGPDYSKATVWAINGDSSNVPGWPVTTDNNVQSSPALGDIDGDGQLEVIVGSGPSDEGGSGNRVYAWNGDGSAVNGWPKTTGGDMAAAPALGDLDRDGDLEIVIGCGAEGNPYPAPCGSLYAWHGDGSSVAGFPVSVYGNDGWTGPNGLPYNPVLADYDGDGSVEILVQARWSWGISTVEADGTNNNDPVLMTQNGLSSPPVVDDVDDDGKLEIIVAGANSSGSNGALYIWDMAGGAGATQPWPMFHHDERRTGNLHFDLTPPENPTVASLTHVPAVWSNDNQVQVSWSGASDDESGIDGYYYAWDTSAETSLDDGASWLDWTHGTLSSGPLGDGTNWYFHIRAANRAGLLGEGTVHFGPMSIDTVPPVSEASAAPCGVESTTASWHGTDTGSGVASYDVQVRDGTGGSWQDWMSGTTDTSAVYEDRTGHTYYFRSKARDKAGNLEAPPAEADAQTWLTRYGFSGSVYNTLGQPVFAAQVTSVPPVLLPAHTDALGNYLLCHDDRLSYALTVSRSGFGELPAMQHAPGNLAGVDFWMRPVDDGIVNGQFETGGAGGWSAHTSESGTVEVTDAAHTGAHAAELSGGGPLAWTAVLSQTVPVSEALENPTLFLLYLFSGGNSAQVTVRGQSETLTDTFSLSTATWTHMWMDLSKFGGQAVTVALHLDGPSGSSGWLVVDEISLGEAAPGARQIYLPVVVAAIRGQ